MASPLAGSPGSPSKSKKPPLHEYPVAKVATDIYSHMGLETQRYNSMLYVDPTHALSASGNTVLYVDLNSGKLVTEIGPDGGGIGAVGVHPIQPLYVVCEKSHNAPKVLICEWPSKKVRKTLRNGAERGYSACAFNDKGDLLATVAIETDFMLTVWNWNEEKTVLRTKAFSADVYTVAFSPYNPGMLVTSGMGHIKFWEMATTFTGLKLQGVVGKFGRLDISDIASFVFLPDGKVISGSECGSLLLWEGHLIKCELGILNVPAEKEGVEFLDNVIPEEYRKKCHDGPIEVVKVIEKGRILMSCGYDGYIRYWSMEEIDQAENNGLDVFCGIKMIKELYLGDNIKVKSVSLSPSMDQWVFLDANGAIRFAPYWGYESITSPVSATQYRALPPVAQFNSGGILSMEPSPNEHTAVTGGEDGTIRLQDYINQKELFQLRFPNSPVTHIRFLSRDQSGRTFITGFSDGSIRVLRKTRNTFELVCEWRPDTSSVLEVAVDQSCRQVYVVSKKPSAFYFKMNEDFSLVPIGFCKLNSGVTCAEWSFDGSVLFLGYKNGNIIALDPPKVDEIDPAVSFEFTPRWGGVGYRQKKKPPEKEKKFGQDDESDDDDFDEEDQGPWGVSLIRRMPSKATYLVAIDHPELCYEYTLGTRYPDRDGPPPLPLTGLEPVGWVEEPGKNYAYRDLHVKKATVSHSGERILVVCDQGRIFIRPYGKVDEIIQTRHLHDGLHGVVTAAVTSFDDHLVVTAGRDGIIFTQKIQGIEPPTIQDAADVDRLPQGMPPKLEVIERSIQEQKDFDDEQRALHAAETKKQQIMRKINFVLDDYKAILKANAESEGGRKLPDEELVLDPELMELLEVEKHHRVEEAALEYSWKSAYKETMVRKLKAVFVDPIKYDRFFVHGFGNGISVASFRTAHLTDKQRADLESINELLRVAQDAAADEEEDEEGSVDDASLTSSPSKKVTSPTHGRSQSPHDFPTDAAEHADPNVASMSKKGQNQVKSQLEKAEERRWERIERRKGYEGLLGRKPRSSEEDPKYLKEILRAEEQMGNYILKSHPDYSIPDHARPNAERKAKQLILLEYSIFKLRCKFNEKLLGMRDLKSRLCVSLNDDRARIKLIAHQLKSVADFSPYALKSEEEPEKRFEITQQGLEKFERDQEKARKRAEALERAKKGFGADLAAGAQEEEEEVTFAEKTATEQMQKRTSMRRRSLGPTGMLSMRDRVDQVMKERIDELKPSELEEEEKAIERELLLFEKQMLERRVAKTIQGFDDSLTRLFQEKMELDADLTMADMRVLLLFREHQMLTEFKQRDSELQKKVDDRSREKHDIEASEKDCEKQRAQKLNELLEIKTGLQQLVQEFLRLTEGMSDTQFKLLDHVYKKPVKRPKQGDEEGSDDDEETASDRDFTDEEEEDEYTGEDGEGEQCPTGIDPAMYEQIINLRAAKWKLDLQAADLRKADAALKEDVENKKGTKKKVTKELEEVKKELEAFQKEKQRQLNLLETIVVLRASQIQCLLDSGELPPTYDTDNIVVFTQAGMKALRHRIVELAEKKHETANEKAGQNQSKFRLMKKKSHKNTEFQDWDSKVYEVQLLKFGQRVDLEMLENVAVDRETEELKARLKMEEIKWEKELMKQNEKFVAHRQAQQQRIAENTVLLKDLGSLRAEQHDLEESLQQSTQKIVAKMSGGSKVATAADRAHLKDLVVAQQQEIDALKNEIAMLRRKGGHVYTPVVNKVGATQ